MSLYSNISGVRRFFDRSFSSCHTKLYDCITRRTVGLRRGRGGGAFDTFLKSSLGCLFVFGCNFSKLQARKAFAMYLRRVKERLMKEVR